MRVLSLFDGLSAGQIALNKLGIKYDIVAHENITEIVIPELRPKKKNTYVQLLFKSIDNICQDYIKLKGEIK